MRHMRTISSWTPKALAVVSFALAILAVQPPINGALPLNHESVVLRGSEAPRSTAHVVVRPSKQSQAIAPLDVPHADSHLRILATVEILQRLLIAELHLRPSMPLTAFALNFEPVYLGTLAPITAVPTPAHDFTPPLPVGSERAYAIARLLLAPPAC